MKNFITWLEGAKEDDEKKQLIAQIQSVQKKQKITPFSTHWLMVFPSEKLRIILTKVNSDTTVPTFNKIKQTNPLDEARPANESYARYVWSKKRDLRPQLKNGLEMNGPHDVFAEWYYLHVGSEEWVAVLNRDYGREGWVSEIIIENLPKGFWIVEDPDIMDKTDTPVSEMIISKNKIIPASCVRISRSFDSKAMEREYPALPFQSDEEYS